VFDLSVRLFAGLREAVGSERISVRLAEGACVRDLVDELARAHETLARHRGRFAVAVNLEVAREETVLRPGDEVALLPPVGGGSDAGAAPSDLVELTSAPIDSARLVSFVTHPSAGGIALFLGTARDHHEGQAVLRLEYEAYESMALESLRAIARATRARFPETRKLAIVHRLGVVPIGEASVAVAVSTPHRAQAFEACRFAIDELKAKAPIWKKERLAEGGARWVENKEGRDIRDG
jgi:molybdopterin synthase catalytic subunit